MGNYVVCCLIVGRPFSFNALQMSLSASFTALLELGDFAGEASVGVHRREYTAFADNAPQCKPGNRLHESRGAVNHTSTTIVDLHSCRIAHDKNCCLRRFDALKYGKVSVGLSAASSLYLPRISYSAFSSVAAADSPSSTASPPFCLSFSSFYRLSCSSSPGTRPRYVSRTRSTLDAVSFNFT